MTLFLTTQYLEEADQLADHLGIIDQGKIVAEGTPQELKAEVVAHRGRDSPRCVRPERLAVCSRGSETGPRHPAAPRPG